MKFEFSTLVFLKIQVFGDVTPSRLVLLQAYLA